MSLVNEMLNELQKENQKPANFEGMVAVENTGGKPFLSRILILSLVPILISITLWFLYFDQGTIEYPDPTISKTNQLATSTQLAISTQPISKITTERPTTQTESIIDKKQTEQFKSLEKTVVASIEQEKNAVVVDKTIKKFVALKNTTPATETIAKETVILDDNKASERLTKKLETKEKLETKSVRPMIQVSRKSLAKRKLHKINNEWGTYTLIQNKKFLDAFLSEFSDLSSAWLGAINLAKDKNFNYSREILTKAVEKFPSQPSIRMIIVKRQIAQQNYQSALSELNKLDSSLWQSIQFKIAGYLAQKVGDHVSAIKFYNQLLKSKPNQGDINMAIAISLEAINESDLAVAKFQHALEDTNLKPIQRQFIAQRIAVLKG